MKNSSVKIKTFAKKSGNKIKLGEEIINRQKTVQLELPIETDSLNEKKDQISKDIECGFLHDSLKQDIYVIPDCNLTISGRLLGTPRDFILQCLNGKKQYYSSLQKDIKSEKERINQSTETFINSLITLNSYRNFASYDFLIMMLELQEKYDETFCILNKNNKICTERLKNINAAIRFTKENYSYDDNIINFMSMQEKYADDISYIRNIIKGDC